jgi:hypothetical protein
MWGIVALSLRQICLGLNLIGNNEFGMPTLGFDPTMPCKFKVENGFFK